MIYTIEDVRELTDYDNHKEMIDNKTGYKSLEEIPVSYIQILNDYVLEIAEAGGRSIYLPIVAAENRRRIMTTSEKELIQEQELAREKELAAEAKRKREQELEREKERAIEAERRREQLAKLRENAAKVDARKARGVKEPSNSLTDEDKRNWWQFLEENYPENHSLARAYYCEPEDDLLKEFGIDKKRYTINEYFEIYGLPRIYTNDKHQIEVVK